jgi:outer membrane protein TolC
MCVVRCLRLVILPAAMMLGGCLSSAEYRQEADQIAAKIITEKQGQALGRTEPFTIDTPVDTLRRRLLGIQNLPTTNHPASIGSDLLQQPDKWPEKDQPKRTDTPDVIGPFTADQPVTLTLSDALQVAARNSRDYQDQKEAVFRAALDLDLEIDRFRNTYAGLLETLLSSDQSGRPSTEGVATSATLEMERRLEAGGSIATRLIVDLAQLLSGDKSSSWGIFADATVTIPLLRGAGRHIVTEPLTQAERDVIYAIWTFERFKKTFAVRVADDYLGVIQATDRLNNAKASYERAIVSARRVRRLQDAGRSRQIEVDQALQQELSTRDSWISSLQGLTASLDRFKFSIGLPVDARIELDRTELDRLEKEIVSRLGMVNAGEISVSMSEAAGKESRADTPIVIAPPPQKGGIYEIDLDKAIRVALDNRLDLRTRLGRVYDAQRAVIVAANALEASVSIDGGLSAGERRSSVSSADDANAQLRFERGDYSVGLSIDLPWERTGERNVYRDSYIRLEQAVRDVQETEDQVKLDVRNNLRSLLQQRESYRIQVVAKLLAERRVASVNLFLEAGRAAIRDLLEAQRDLQRAEDAKTAAMINYRVSELELQRDMEVLLVDDKGLWREYDPTQLP